ncbi:hypothetical protein [Ascidiimonas sp. W6]|uniref:hypothetical protein n=1 Tax=Ascidiimonas meishanensis TaxID=3128903 RepID=UPI0030EF8CBF
MKYSIYFSVLLCLWALPVMAQVPGWNAGSNGGSVLILAPLAAIDLKLEPDLRREVEDFADLYKHRMDYYAGTALDRGVVADLDEIIVRTNTLILDNESLAFFYPFKKKDNREKLNLILTHIMRLDAELRTSVPDMIYGERINLNQNAEMTLEEIHRKLDDIESNIAKSRILSVMLGL